MKFEVLTTMTMKSKIFWDLTPYNLVEVYRPFGGMYSFYRQSKS
jgi:hypothetical protein